MQNVLDFRLALVTRARQGNRRALGALHKRFTPMVHAVLLARVPPGEAEDLVQDVFARALQKIHTLKDSGSFGAWLCALARNMAADFHRRPARPAPLPEDLPAPADSGAAAREALAAIRSLPEAYAETLSMRLVEGMTGPEIAAATGLTPGSVRVNLHRGMKLLRERLGGGDS